ncbi:hypothetical protein ABTE42_20310, partial [Acinetobacter baumannii]
PNCLLRVVRQCSGHGTEHRCVQGEIICQYDDDHTLHTEDALALRLLEVREARRRLLRQTVLLEKRETALQAKLAELTEMYL